MVEDAVLLGCDTLLLDDHSPKFRIPHHRNVGNQFSSDAASLLLQKKSVVSTINFIVGNLFKYIAPKPALEPTEPPIGGLPEAFFPEANRLERETDHEPQSSAQVKSLCVCVCSVCVWCVCVWSCNSSVCLLSAYRDFPFYRQKARHRIPHQIEQAWYNSEMLLPSIHGKRK